MVFTRVWVTAILVKSPGLVSGFWPFLAMLSSRPLNNPFVIVPKAPISTGTIFTFMFHTFCNSLARSRYLSFFPHSFRLILWSTGTAKSTILQILFLLLIITRSDLLAGIRWSVCMSHSPIGIYASHFLGQVLGCAYTICLYGRIEISCTFPSGSPCRPFESRLILLLC